MHALSRKKFCGFQRCHDRPSNELPFDLQSGLRARCGLHDCFHVANPTANAIAILEAAKACHQRSVAAEVFPELCLSGYAIEGLLLQDAVLDATERALTTIVESSVGVMTLLVVVAPFR
jgi:hypothetical protein